VISRPTWAKMRVAFSSELPAYCVTPLQVTSAIELPRETFGTLTIDAPELPRFAYEFTPEDALWAARLILAEAGGRDGLDNLAVLRAMFNHYAFFAHKRYPTFHQFIRAYATSLHPVLRNWQAAKRLMNRRDFAATGGYYRPPHAENVPRGQLRRHLDIQKTPWRQLPEEARALVERVMKGEDDANPIGVATDFVSTYLLLRQKLNEEGSEREPTDDEWRQFTENFRREKGFQWIGPAPELNQKKNAFFARTLSIPGTAAKKRYANLPPDTVHVTPPSR